MKHTLIALVLIVETLLPAVSQSQGLLSDSIVKALKMGVEGFKDRYHSPSIVVAIVHGNQVIFSDAQGYIDLAKKIPATLNSVYPIQSVTKMFTATMFMQLAERNTVHLDDDVKKYVPEYKGSTNLPGKSGTTLLQLATHTSGLPRNTPADIRFTKQVDKWLLGNVKEPAFESATKTEFLQTLKYITKLYPAYQLLSYGDRHYSNLGYSLLRIALERAAKTDYADYVVKNICQPLAMTNSGFNTERFDKKDLATGYYFNDSTKEFIKTPPFTVNSALGAGGLYSCASDLVKFISFQFNTDPVSAAKVLSEDNRAMMQTFGIGWKRSYPVVQHEGSMVGYRCEIVLNPALKVGWVILTNTTNFDFSRMNEYMGKLVFPLFEKKPINDLAKFTGTYQLPGGYDSLTIYVKDGNLYSTYLQDSLSKVALSSSGYNKFKGQEKGGYNIGYEFLENEQGEIKGVIMGQLQWVRR